MENDTIILEEIRRLGFALSNHDKDCQDQNHKLRSLLQTHAIKLAILEERMNDLQETRKAVGKQAIGLIVASIGFIASLLRDFFLP